MSTQVADKRTLNPQMLILLGVLKLNLDFPTDIIIGRIDRKFDFLPIAGSDLEILLIRLAIQDHIDVDGPFQPAQEGCHFVLRITFGVPFRCISNYYNHQLTFLWVGAILN